MEKKGMSLFSSSSRFGGVVRYLTVGCGAVLVLVAGLAFADTYDLQNWSGRLPAAAVGAGEAADGSVLYVCIVDSWGGQHPGRLTEAGQCQVAWGGQGHSFDDGFMVLSGSSPNGNWQQVDGGGAPDGAFKAGDDGAPIYICRFDVAGGLHPGKLTDDGWCYVAIDGVEEVATGNFEVLVE